MRKRNFDSTSRDRAHYLVVTGRPNAGKSSLLRNILRRDIYKKFNISTGKKPGTTRKIREMRLLGGHLVMVDFPGWGRLASRSMRYKNRLLDDMVSFLETRGERVVLAFHVIDLRTFREVSSRLEKKGYIPIDLEMIGFLQEIMSPSGMLYVVLTKIDKFSSKTELESELRWARSVIPSNVQLFPVDNKGGQGVFEVKKAMYRHLKSFFSKEQLQDVFAVPSR